MSEITASDDVGQGVFREPVGATCHGGRHRRASRAGLGYINSSRADRIQNMTMSGALPAPLPFRPSQSCLVERWQAAQAACPASSPGQLMERSKLTQPARAKASAMGTSPRSVDARMRGTSCAARMGCRQGSRHQVQTSPRRCELRRSAFCRCIALEGAVDRRAGHAEQLSEVGDGVLTGAGHADEFALLLG